MFPATCKARMDVFVESVTKTRDSFILSMYKPHSTLLLWLKKRRKWKEKERKRKKNVKQPLNGFAFLVVGE